MYIDLFKILYFFWVFMLSNLFDDNILCCRYLYRAYDFFPNRNIFIL